MERYLEFGNDKSRIVRGIAIILMVTGHTLPGKVISFAVPLFSFLVGYGYAFARERNLRHGAHRVWHLLKEYWIILFGICLPTALLFYPRPIPVSEIVLGMFGLFPRLSFFSWYVYFYIFAMAMMPMVSRIVDRYGWRGVISVSLVSAGLMLAAEHYQTVNPHIVFGAAYRCFRYLPIVVAGYWLASNKIFSRIVVPSAWWVAPFALLAMVGIYFTRGWEYARIIDLIWAPTFAALSAIALAPKYLAPLRKLLTLFGIQSGKIWFLHALFITHCTKVLFGRLVDWIAVPAGKVIAILLLSYLMAIIIDKIVAAFNKTLTGLKTQFQKKFGMRNAIMIIFCISCSAGWGHETGEIVNYLINYV